MGLVYVIIAYGISLTSLKGLVMALAYCWGLVLAIYLMGHGLVSIPRRLIRNASLTGKLRRLQSHAPKLHEQMEDATLKVDEVEAQVHELGRRKVGSAADFRDWIEELQDLANVPESQARSSIQREVLTAGQTIPTVITEKFLADLTRKLIRARHSKSQHLDQWNHLVQEANETQMIIDSGASKKLDFGEADPHAGFWEKTKIFTPYTRHLYYFYFVPYAQVALGAFLGMSSVCVVWSEVIKVPFPMLSVIRYTVAHHWSGERPEVGFAGQVISSFWICYMCAAALISMTEVKVWRGRALVKRNTAYESAFWYALQVAKLSIPISYNFMTFLSPRVYDKTIFYKFLGQQVDLTPLGRWFDNLYPIFVLLPILATLFGLYGKVKRMFVGMDMIDDEEDGPTFGTGSWREGRDLIERELGGNSVNRRREEAFARLSASTSGTGAGATSRTGPVLSVPSTRASASSPARSPIRSKATGLRAAGQSSWAPVLDEPQDDNLFTILGHRMKNTIDTFDSPQWVKDMKKPKWMGGDENDGNDGGSGGGGGAQERPGHERRSSADIRRWFGGSGSIRL